MADKGHWGCKQHLERHKVHPSFLCLYNLGDVLKGTAYKMASGTAQTAQNPGFQGDGKRSEGDTRSSHTGPGLWMEAELDSRENAGQ